MYSRKSIYKFAAVAVLVMASMLPACSETKDEPTPGGSQDVPEGMVPFDLTLGGAYNHSRAANNSNLHEDMIKFLPDGSTMRLVILKDIPADEEIKASDTLRTFTYVIESDKFGNPYPFPCSVYDDGSIVPGSKSQVPYYLPAPTSGEYEEYVCMAISPAKALGSNNDGSGEIGATVKNQETMLVTNNHWEETKYSTFKVYQDVSKRANAVLKPLMHTTCRLTFTIKNGDNVTDLSPGSPLLEIDRVPTNPGEKWTDEKGVTHTRPLYNLIFGDSISSEVGNNILYNRMYVTDSKVSEERAGTSITDKKITIFAETHMLPMHARPTPMIIRLNLDVNLTPMQFQFQSNLVFRPGFSYNYEATVSLEEGRIYVVSWQDRQWGTPLTPVN